MFEVFGPRAISYAAWRERGDTSPIFTLFRVRHFEAHHGTPVSRIGNTLFEWLGNAKGKCRHLSIVEAHRDEKIQYGRGSPF